MEIFHILTQSDWQNSTPIDPYQPQNFAHDGFIHCSKLSQVLEVAERFYSNHTNLLLLQIDTGKVNSPVIYENLEGGKENYPHIYGPLEKKAIIAVHTLARDTNNRFLLPSSLSNT